METSSVTCYSYNNRQGVTIDTEKRSCWRLTFYEVLTVICAAAVPVAVGIYAAISAAQLSRQAEQTRQFEMAQAAELEQQELYDKFLTDMYTLDKDGHLHDNNTPWVFANAYHRAAHRQWDAIRKADVLQFLREEELIGQPASSSDRSDTPQPVNKIRLNELSFDNINLISQTKSLKKLNLTYVSFDYLSMVNATFSFVDLERASFTGARLNYVKFDDSFLTDTSFDSTELQYTNFGNSDLTRTRFSNVNLLTAILSREQIQQAIFYNSTLPNGTVIQSVTNPVSVTTIETTDFTIETTDPTELSSQDVSNIETNATEIPARMKHQSITCIDRPCKNNGTCNDYHTTYNCLCVPQYTGTNCEIPVIN